MTLANRRVLTAAQFDENLMRLGYRQQDDREKITRLLQQIPGPSDLVRFGLREVWDPAVVTEFGYDDEFPVPFSYWMQQQGMDWSEDVVVPGGDNIPGVTWAKAYWRAHWQSISPTQAYEMLHRLRGNKNDPATWRVPGVRPFDIDDVRRVLKIADYPAPFRDRLAAISYRVIGIRQVRSLVNNGLWGDVELRSGFRDQGYSETDAVKLSQTFLADAENAKLKKSLAGQKSAVLRGYESGILSRQESGVQLLFLDVPNSIAYEVLQSLPYDELVLRAQQNLDVQRQLNNSDLDVKTKLVHTAINAIKKAYLRYELSQQAAEQALLELGITQARAAENIDLWRWQLYGRGKHLAVGQIKAAVVRGVITQEEAIARLALANYPLADSLALVTMWIQDQSQYIARAQQAVARTRNQQQRALIAEQRALQQRLRQARHDLAYNAPVVKLKKWLAKGLISDREARLRMAALGHDLQFINREIADAVSKLKFSSKDKAERIVETPLPPDVIRSGG
jgi:hypothetical protein